MGQANDSKLCTCCGTLIPRAEWNAIPNLGEPMVSEEDGVVFSLQLKNHSCGGTLGEETVYLARRAA